MRMRIILIGGLIFCVVFLGACRSSGRGSLVDTPRSAAQPTEPSAGQGSFSEEGQENSDVGTSDGEVSPVQSPTPVQEGGSDQDYADQSSEFTQTGTCNHFWQWGTDTPFGKVITLNKGEWPALYVHILLQFGHIEPEASDRDVSNLDEYDEVVHNGAITRVILDFIGSNEGWVEVGGHQRWQMPDEGDSRQFVPGDQFQLPSQADVESLICLTIME